MILANLLAVLPSLLAAGDPKVEWSAPAALLVGDSYEVELRITAPEGGAKVPSWMLTAAAFEVDGKPLGKRDGAAIDLPAGFTLSGALDLGPQIKAAKDFKLAHASGQGEALSVGVMTPAPAGLNFMDEAAMPVAELAKYQVLLRTSRGDILLKLWPETAPKHVRNFLDLVSIRFYDDKLFHRVIPGFMIQGGCPNGTGTGNGPRMIPAEFQTERKHVRGVLSAARTNDPNSASCQFFIMHAPNQGLDGQYSAFGETVFGLDVVDRIVNAPRDARDKPREAQRIERAIVVKTKN